MITAARKSPSPERVLVFGGAPGASAFGTACAVALEHQRELYRVDLAAGVNLAALIERAEEQNWILFFDEANLRFGKRTSVRDSHDRYTNLEVSGLLDRLRSFNGVAVFAINSETDVDDALRRRFQRVFRLSSKSGR
jgi:hypothetical protein